MPFLIQTTQKKTFYFDHNSIENTNSKVPNLGYKRSGVFLKKAREILFIQNFTYHQKRINKVSVRTTILCRSIFVGWGGAIHIPHTKATLEIQVSRLPHLFSQYVTPR